MAVRTFVTTRKRLPSLEVKRSATPVATICRVRNESPQDLLRKVIGCRLRRSAGRGATGSLSCGRRQGTGKRRDGHRAPEDGRANQQGAVLTHVLRENWACHVLREPLAKMHMQNAAVASPMVTAIG